MRAITSLLAVAIVSLIAISAALPAHAASIYTAQEDGTPTSNFQMGANIRIIAQSMTVPFYITIKDPDGIMRHTETVYASKYDQVLSDISDKPGWWTIKLTPSKGPTILGEPTEPTSTEYQTVLNNVVPEVPLGTISAALTLLAALGVVTLRRRPFHRPAK
jgi:hypothetical protein